MLIRKAICVCMSIWMIILLSVSVSTEGVAISEESQETPKHIEAYMVEEILQKEILKRENFEKSAEIHKQIYSEGKDNSEIKFACALTSEEDSPYIHKAILSDNPKEDVRKIKDENVLELYEVEKKKNVDENLVEDTERNERESTKPTPKSDAEVTLEEVKSGIITLEDGISYEVVESIEFIATAYCHCKKCCGKSPSNPAYGITHSGVNLLEQLEQGQTPRVIAADPEVFAFGTKMFIEVPESSRDRYVTEDFGIVSVEDTGSKIKNKKIDVYFPTDQQAVEWGKRNVIVHVLAPVA